jgi:hypothetical protein
MPRSGRAFTGRRGRAAAGTQRPRGQATQESATFKRVQQARRHELWRVAHTHDPEVAMRVMLVPSLTRKS